MSHRQIITVLPFCLITAFAAMFACTPAHAQSQALPDELQAVYACKSISQADKRLACYDRTVGRFEKAEKSGEVVTVSKSAIEKVERDAFGFNIPSLPSLGRLFGGGRSTEKNEMPDGNNILTAPVKEVSRDDAARKPVKPPVINNKPQASAVTDVSLELRKVTEFGYKKKRFFMTNGQVWEQIGTAKVRIPKIKNGKANTVEIRKAAVGSFLLQINGKGSAIRVKRVR